MNIPQIVFLMLSYSILGSLIVGDVYGEEVQEFPTLSLSLDFPEFNLTVNDSDCGTIEKCIRYLANGLVVIAEVIAFIAESIWAFINLVFELLAYVFEVFAFLLTFIVSGIDGAPSYVNLMIQAPMLIGIGLIIYKMLRSGSSAA